MINLLNQPGKHFSQIEKILQLFSVWILKPGITIPNQNIMLFVLQKREEEIMQNLYRLTLDLNNESPDVQFDMQIIKLKLIRLTTKILQNGKT